MRRHANFDLALHTDEELSALLDDEVVQRTELWVWPFSSVEHLDTASGNKWVYKSQRDPTLEPRFYEAVSSSLLPAHVAIPSAPPFHWILLEYLEGPTLEQLPIDQDRKSDVLLDASARIGELDCDGSVHIDCSDLAAWERFSGEVIANLSALVADGRFPDIGSDDLRKLDGWTRSSVVRELFADSQLTHGDLKPSNVFWLNGDLKVIDWQRPRRCPAEVERLSVSAQFGLDGDSAAIPMDGLRSFLDMSWPIECELKWLPSGGAYQAWVIPYLERILVSDRNGGSG